MKKPFSTTGGRDAFTLVELLVVIAIIGVLIALLLPAVQAAREAARRTDCTNRMKQSALACHNYHDTELAFPAGAYVWTLNADNSSIDRIGQNWCMQLLPYIEQQSLYRDLDSEIYNQKNSAANAGTTSAKFNSYRAAQQVPVSTFSCPSDPGPYGIKNLNPSSGPTSSDQSTKFALSSQVAISGRSLGIYGSGGQGRGAYNPYPWWGDLPKQWMGILHVVGSDLTASSGWASGTGFYEGKTRSFSNETFASVTDGTSNTVLLAERHYFDSTDEARTRRSAFWGLSYAAFVNSMAMPVRSTLAAHRYDECRAGAVGDTTQTCYSGIGANHTNGSNVALADASVKFQSEKVNLDIWCTSAAMGDADQVPLP